MKNFYLVLLALLSFLLFTTPTMAANSDLISRYHLNENTNNTTQDSSGNDLVGQDYSISLVPGKYGNAFDTSNGGYVQITDTSLLEPANVSVEAWVKAVNFPGSYQYVLSKGANGCNVASYALYTGATGGLQFYISNGTTFATSPDAGRGIWDGKWHYVVGSFDGATVRLYVDGQQVSQGTPTTITPAYNFPDGNDLYIGRYNGTCLFGFNGQLDEVRIWNRALTSNEITQHYGTNSIWTDNNY